MTHLLLQAQENNSSSSSTNHCYHRSLDLSSDLLKLLLTHTNWRTEPSLMSKGIKKCTSFIHLELHLWHTQLVLYFCSIWIPRCRNILTGSLTAKCDPVMALCTFTGKGEYTGRSGGEGEHQPGSGHWKVQPALCHLLGQARCSLSVSSPHTGYGSSEAALEDTCRQKTTEFYSVYSLK